MGNYFEADIGDLSEEEMTHPWLTLEKGLENALKETGKSYDDDYFVARMYRMKQVRRRVIGYYRSRIIDAILAAGYTIHVYGESWHSYRGIHKERLVIHPQATVEESLRELGKAKIGLNIMSWHKAGMTERIANIMLSGAVCLTEETTYLREHFVDGREIVCFDLEHLDRLPVLIHELLENEPRRHEIAEKAYEKARAVHTWYVRAGQLIDLAEKL